MNTAGGMDYNITHFLCIFYFCDKFIKYFDGRYYDSNVLRIAQG
ncbi:hypothetical protein C1O63_0229 [Dehalococcoides mccartyi]|nr:hypothetical protein C1O63_0229 [Dehalococcoides mccartyi]